MNKYLIGIGAIAVLALGLFVGYALHPVSSPSLGSFIPNPASPTAAGFSGVYATSTALTPAQYAYQNILVNNTTALATGTLPAATTTYASYGSANFGVPFPTVITNDSTNTFNLVAGTGDTFLCETQGVGTTTVLGGCTASQLSVNPTSTLSLQSYFDAASGTMKILVGNMNH